MKESEKKYRVLTCYYRPKPGGFCKRLFRAIDALLTRGHIVHYLAVVPFPITHPNCHFHRFPWPEKHTSGYLFWLFFHIVAPLQLFYLGCRYTINRIFSFGHNYSLLLQPLRLIKRVPLTVFLRGDAIANHRIRDRSCLLVGLEHGLEGMGIAGTRMYGVSETLTNKTIARHRISRPLTSGVLHNDIAQYSITIEQPRPVHTPFRLASVGMLEPIKNQRFLLKLMEEIKADHAQLYFYGIGPDERLLKEIVKIKKLADRVHFMGWIAPERIWPEVDLLLMPSLHEGAPNAVLEALGHGIPVLASAIPEHREILPECCLQQENHVEQWVTCLNQSLPDLLDMVADILEKQAPFCRQFQFDWDDAINDHIIKQ